MNSKYYTIPEAAKIMDIDQQVLRKWIKDKSIEFTETPTYTLLEKTYIDNFEKTIFKKVKPNENSKTK